VPRGDEGKLRAGLAALIALKPGSTEADKLRWSLEPVLMGILKEHGLRTSMRIVERAGPPGIALTTTVGGLREYTWLSDDRSSQLSVSVHSNRLFKSVHVMWQESRIRPLTPKEQVRHERQEAFYEAYNSIVEKAYGPRPPRILGRDRIVLLIGEFEADVNNGGFAQFLDNKGRLRAKATIGALRTIKAEKTAAMLEAAMKVGVTEEELGRLDSRFYKGLEDLAELTTLAHRREP
jgi:hypothetical protein